MNKLDLRAKKRDHAIYNTLCKKLNETSELTDLNFTIDVFSSEARVSRATLRRRIQAYQKASGSRSRKLSAWALIRMTDAQIKDEFRLRRKIQAEELNVGDSITDFLCCIGNGVAFP